MIKTKNSRGSTGVRHLISLRINIQSSPVAVVGGSSPSSPAILIIWGNSSVGRARNVLVRLPI